MIALLTGKYRLSKRAIPELLYDLLGVTFSVGTIANVEQLVSDALAAQVEEVEQYVRKQSVVYADDTGAFQWTGGDVWFVAVVEGDQPMHPVTNKIPRSVTNPVYIDRDGDSAWTPPGL